MHNVHCTFTSLMVFLVLNVEGIYIYFCGDSGGDGGSTVGAHSRHWVLVVQHPDDGHHDEGDFDDIVQQSTIRQTNMYTLKFSPWSLHWHLH